VILSWRTGLGHGGRERKMKRQLLNGISTDQRRETGEREARGDERRQRTREERST